MSRPPRKPDARDTYGGAAGEVAARAGECGEELKSAPEVNFRGHILNSNQVHLPPKSSIVATVQFL